MAIGLLDFGDLLAGKVSWQALLPELMTAFDLTFGLGCRSVTEADPVKSKCPAQLGKSIGNVGKKQRVVIDIYFQWEPKLQERQIGRAHV